MNGDQAFAAFGWFRFSCPDAVPATKNSSIRGINDRNLIFPEFRLIFFMELDGLND
jgi:hypothetical protein